MGVTYKEVVYDKGEGGRVSVVVKEHGGGGFRVVMLGEESDKTKLG